MKKKVVFKFPSENMADCFTAWFLDGGGRDHFSQALEDDFEAMEYDDDDALGTHFVTFKFGKCSSQKEVIIVKLKKDKS